MYVYWHVHVSVICITLLRRFAAAGFHRDAQAAHRGAGERSPFGLRGKLLLHSCNDVSSRCRSETERVWG